MATIWTDKKRSLFFGLPLSFTKYICTDEKFIVETGMLSTRDPSVPNPGSDIGKIVHAAYFWSWNYQMRYHG